MDVKMQCPTVPTSWSCCSSCSCRVLWQQLQVCKCLTDTHCDRWVVLIAHIPCKGPKGN